MEGIAKIVAHEIEDRYARGWHYIGMRQEFVNEPLRLACFGTLLVGYRGEDGEVHVLDGYCPHMGADLCEGAVEGNSIRCPFHAWRWGSDGVCDEIPYATRIPDKAKIKKWPTMEVNGLVFVWNDPEGSEPTCDITIPNINIDESDEWTDWIVRTSRINTNCRELIDNVSDKAHFATVHHSEAVEFTNIFERHIATQIMLGINDGGSEFDDSAEMISTATYYGPAVMIDDMKQIFNGHQVESIWLNSHRPVDLNSFDLCFGVAMKKIKGLSDEENKAFVQAYVTASQASFDQDIKIWYNKTRVDNPVLCDGDGPINMLRQWYQQFYVDVDQVPEKWNARREFNV